MSDLEAECTSSGEVGTAVWPREEDWINKSMGSDAREHHILRLSFDVAMVG